MAFPAIGPAWYTTVTVPVRSGIWYLSDVNSSAPAAGVFTRVGAIPIQAG